MLVFVTVGLMNSGCALMHLGDPPPPPEVDHVSESAVATKAVSKSLDYFLYQVRHGNGEKFLARVLLPAPDDSVEALWLTHVSVRGRTVSGYLAETPMTVPKHRKGTLVKVSRDAVVDWLMVRRGLVYGGFTERPKLQSSLAPK